MCIRCGRFLACGSCVTHPEFDGYNGRATNMFFQCKDKKCSKDSSTNRKPGVVLRRLLDEKPTGPHVKYTRLLLAQIMLNDVYSLTGIRQDAQAARKEYLWLAHDLDYAPAQLALASFYDPDDHRENYIWDGPIPFHILLDDGEDDFFWEPPPSPFLPNKERSKEHYERAVAQKMPNALTTVGTMLKNGNTDVYPTQNLELAAKYLESAADMGDALAACNVSNMYMQGMGVEQNIGEAIGYLKKAANHGLLQAAMHLRQLGVPP